jgi:hypothetical protein
MDRLKTPRVSPKRPRHAMTGMSGDYPGAAVSDEA